MQRLNLLALLPVLLAGSTWLAGCTDKGTDSVADTDAVDPDTDADALLAPVVSIAPQTPLTIDDLIATVASPDPDATYTWSWTQDGARRPDVTGATVPAIATRRDQLWTASVVADKGGAVSPPGEASVTVINAPPEGTLTLEPSAPTTLDALVATVDATDLDEDTVTWTYAWTRDGTQSAVTAATVPSTATRKGQVWAVTATPSDGADDGSPLTASLTIGNSPPSVTAVTLAPASPDTLDPIAATPRGTDADGDTLTYTYVWHIDGAPVTGVTGPTLPPDATGRDDRVHVRVTASDGGLTSAGFDSDVVVVANTPASITGVTVTPANPDSLTDLTCNPAGWSDVDGDPPDYRFTWQIGGITQSGFTDAVLPASEISRADSVTCSATPYDGDLGIGLVSPPVVVINTAPVLSRVVLSSLSPRTDDQLTASAQLASDADGDLLNFETRWYRNNNLVSNDPSYGPPLQSGSLVYAEMRASDGQLQSPWVRSPTALVQNSRPVLSNVRVIPTAPRTNDTIRVDFTTADADGHTVTVTWSFRVDGNLVQSSTSPILAPSLTEKGDVIRITGVPNDGFDSGTAVTPADVVVRNTAPTTTRPTITPVAPRETDSLTCTPGSFSDIDGDVVVARFSWEVDGAVVPVTLGTLDGAWFDRGDEVACTVTPYDGEVQGNAVRSTPVSVGNTPPTLAGAVLSDTMPDLGEILYVTPVTPFDADGDAVSYAYLWYVDDVPSITDASFDTSLAAQGARIRADVTILDADSVGDTVQTNVATVQNIRPVITTVGISPLTPTTLEDLVADWTGSDPDGDPLTALYQWTINGAPVVGVGTDEDTLSYLFTDKNDVIRCGISLTDGFQTSTTRTAGPAVVRNSPPSISAVDVGPANPVAGSTLTCTAVGWSDVDGDPQRVSYQWAVNGANVGTSSTLSSSLFGRGDGVICTVLPDDGDIGGRGLPVASDTVIIGNSPPTVAGVNITPASPSELDVLRTSAVGASDPDGDVVAYRWIWFVNGVQVGQAGSLTGGSFDKGDTVTVQIFPSDGTLEGAPVTSPPVVIGNAPPTVLSVSIGPPDPSTTDTLEATVNVVDLDAADTVTLTYDWYVDDVLVQSGPDYLLPPGFLSTGSRVHVVVTPTDGIDAGAPFDSGLITIDNSPPSITGVTITPSTVYETTTLTCVPTGWFDADNDPPGYEFAWIIDGVVVGTRATVTGARFDRGDDVVCEATPFDGTSRGAPVSSAPVTVLNSLPRATAVGLSSTAPTERSTVTVVLTELSDPDGDPITVQRDWYINGVYYATKASLTGIDFDKGDTLYAVVTLSDGVGTQVYTTATVTVRNAVPFISGLAISPTAPVVTQDITSTYLVFDDDGDPVTITWRWYSDDVLISGQTTDTLPAQSFTKNRELYLVATPNDGTVDGATVTSNIVTSVNSPPTAASATVVPSPVTELTPPTCTPGVLADVDGDPVTYVTEWRVNGTPSTTATTLPARDYARGDQIRCVIVPYDGEAFGAPAESDLVPVVNSPPVVGSLVLNSLSPREGDIMSATAVGVFDADQDQVSLRWKWFVNGTQVSTAAQIDSNLFSRGDTIYAQVTPFDGNELGTTVTSATATVVNRPPQLSGPVSLSPNQLYTNTEVTASVTPTDRDGDAVRLTWTWRVNGSVVLTGVDENTLDGTSFSRGDQVQAFVVTNDGFTDGSTASSSVLTVRNSPPQPPSVAVDPTDPVGGVDDIVCSVTTPSFDLDGDPVTYQFRWTVDNLPFQPTFTTATTSTIESGVISSSDTWRCQVRANDGIENGPYSAAAIARALPAPNENDCLDYYVGGSTTSGTYLINTPIGTTDAYCDMTTDGGGWTRIIRTTSYNEDYGQSTVSMVGGYAGVNQTGGVYLPFGGVSGFSKVMIKQVTGAQAGLYASFDIGSTGANTMYDLLEACRDQAESPANDTAFDGVRQVGHTSAYSGQRTAGTLKVAHHLDGTRTNAAYFFVCGVNESFDNDVSYMAFTAMRGDSNDWGDAWRGAGQVGTIWSFASNDYYRSPSHIGRATMQGYAGWKGQGISNAETWHQGTYEIYVR